MPIDVLTDEWSGLASFLLARLCEEAKVCLHDSETNRVEMHEATWDVHEGLVVMDERGERFRLRATAEKLPKGV